MKVHNYLDAEVIEDADNPICTRLKHIQELAYCYIIRLST